MNRQFSWRWSAIALIAVATFLTACGKDTDSDAPAQRAADAQPAEDHGDVEYEGMVPGAVLEEEDPVWPGTVSLINVQGDAYTAGQSFTIDVAFEGEGAPFVQAYQMRVAYDDSIVSLERIQDVDLGGSPPSLGKRYGAEDGVETGVEQSFGTLGNFDNRETEMTFCRLYFDVLATPDAAYSIRLAEDSPNEVLVTIDFKGGPFVFDDSATDPMPRP